MNETLSQLIRNTKEYSDVCDMCKDEILIYPTISGRTEYTQDEVEQITLKRIIDKLQAKEQECERLKRKVELMMDCPDCKVDEYKKALEEIEELVKSLNENRMCFYDDVNDCSNCDMNTDCNYLRKFKILDIINKAKGE